MKSEHEIPDNLGSYAVVKDGAVPHVLGKGDWGAVYKAFNSKLRCFAALRIIPHSAFPTEEAKQKFSADVRMATYITGHRHLAAVFPLEQTENAYLYGAELCTGKKLIDRIEREGCLPAEVALSAAKQVAEVLDTISKTGFQHHRITARNIMLEEGEDETDLGVKVLDLALPRANSSESGATLECDFRSPEEKIDGSSIDPRSAIYTVGAVLYYMLVGSEKYLALCPKSSANQDNWPDDSLNISPACVAILEKTLCHDPALRLQTFVELRQLLEQVIDSPEAFEAAQRELALRRAQEEEEAKRRAQEEADAARRAREEEEANRRALEESAMRRAQEEQEAQRREQEKQARLRAQEEEAAQRREQEEQARQRAQEEEALQRKAQEEQARLQAQEEAAARTKAQEQEAQRRAQKEAARRTAEAEKQRLAALQTDQKRQASRRRPRPEDEVKSEAEEAATGGSFPWGWVGAVMVLLLGGLAGFYFFWPGKPSPQPAEHQTATAPATVAANPPANELPSQAGPTSSPTPAAPVPLPPQPVPVTSGKLVIDTDPTGARVTLDGKPAQTAPCTFSDLFFGKHHFIVERDGYMRRELDLPFNGSPLAPIRLEPLPDPLQGLVDRIKAAPHDSPANLRASLDYLQQVKTQPPSRQLSPVTVQQDLSSALLDREKKMISLPQYHHKDVYKELLENHVLEDAKSIDSVSAISVPATVMLADDAFGVDDAKALDLFKSAANKNDRYAMRMLGKLYEQTQDFEKSKEWINKASDAGDAYAHVLQLYNTLRDKNNDDSTTKLIALKQLESEVEEWEKALATGDASIDLPTLGRAELLLGNYYYETYQTSQKHALADQSDPKDYRQVATELYKKSTEHGEPLGYYGLGKMALDAHDLAEAKAQFEKGAGESPACTKALAKLNQ